MIQTVKLYTFDPKSGKEITTEWNFEPLTDRDGSSYDRENTQGTNRKLRRRPFARQEVRTIVLGAGFLLIGDNARNLQRMFDAHRIQWQRYLGGNLVWLDYDLDADDKLDFERVEDLDPLKRITIKLVQSDPVWFTDFESTKFDLAL